MGHARLVQLVRLPPAAPVRYAVDPWVATATQG